jgi:amino acid adenylation domain-containing protein
MAFAMRTHDSERPPGPHGPDERHEGVQADAFVPFPRARVEQSVPAAFADQVERHAERLAVQSRSQALTYRALDADSNRIAHAISRLRGDREEPVALLIQQGTPLIAAILGALKAGKLYVPLDASMSPEALGRIAEHCGAPLILADAANRSLAHALAARSRAVLEIDDAREDISHESPGLGLSTDRGAYIFYTSGSTGEPKGVVDSHRNLLHNVMRYTNSLAITPQDRLSLVQASSFSGSVSNIFCALLNGAAVFPFDLRRERAAELSAWVQRERLTIFHSVPAVFERLVAARRELPSLRIIRLEGDQATSRHVKLFQESFGAGCRLVNGLGATETGITRQFFIDPQTPRADGAVPIGYPVQDMEILLLDEEAKPVAAGEVGEIVVRSRYLAVGYWKRPDLTSAAFTPDPEDGELRSFRTGDMGVMSPDGCLTYRGRKHFDVKVRGQRVDVEALESVLRGLDGVEDARVALREDPSGTQQLVAYLIATDLGPPTVGVLRRALSPRFPSHAIPARYVTLDAWPMDPNGKVDRRALPPPADLRPDLEPGFVPPRTAREEAVAACFAQVLGLPEVGVHDDFFDLGGDSLKALELALLLEERLALEIAPEMFFQGFTVGQVAQHAELERESPNLVSLGSEGAHPPLFLFHNEVGHVLEYRKLAAGLSGDRPVFALQYNGAPERYALSPRLPDLVAHYVPEIRRAQPRGPYFLAGQCFGGLVAFEAAQQLRALGEEVALLALIDTAYPGGHLARLAHHVSLGQPWQRLSTTGLRAALSHLARRVRSDGRFALAALWRLGRTTIGRRLGGGARPLPRLLKRPDDIHRLAKARYRAQAYDGAIVVICVGSPRNQIGWKQVARGGFEVVALSPIPGVDTQAFLTDPPYVADLTRTLRTLLERS